MYFDSFFADFFMTLILSPPCGGKTQAALRRLNTDSVDGSPFRPERRYSRYSLMDSPGLMNRRRMAMRAISSELSRMPHSSQRVMTPRYAAA